MTTALPAMVEIIPVALGSALGAVSRFALAQWILRIDSRFPLLATLLVNLSGCGLAGLLAGSAWQSHEPLAGFLATGFLGSYTTVSSLSLESLGLWQSGRRGRAAAYVMASMMGGLLVARAGWLLAAHSAGLS